MSTSIMHNQAWSIWDAGTLLLAFSQPAASLRTPDVVGLSNNGNAQPAGSGVTLSQNAHLLQCKSLSFVGSCTVHQESLCS